MRSPHERNTDALDTQADLRPRVYPSAPATHCLSPRFVYTPAGTDIRESSFKRAWEAIAAAGGQRLITDPTP